MKDDQSQKIINARVRESGHDDGHGLGEERNFEVRTLRHVAQVICLQQQWRPRVSDVRQVPHGVTKTRWNNDDDYCHDHHDAAEHDQSPRYHRLLDHGVAFLLRLFLDPIRHDHAYDRHKILMRAQERRISVSCRSRDSARYHVKNFGIICKKLKK